MSPQDGGPWRGIDTATWIERIARNSTPAREYVDGSFVPWIDAPTSSRLADDPPRRPTSGQPEREGIAGAG